MSATARARTGAATSTAALAPTPLPSSVLELLPHPLQPAPTGRSLMVSVTPATDGGLSLHFCLRGELDGLRVPAPQTPCATDGLWMHTCFEAFIAVQGEPAYREFNFSPSGQWASYAFAACRERDHRWTTTPAPTLEFAHGTHALDLHAHIPAAALPPQNDDALIEMGLSAVMEERDGSLSYWALRHPAERPDFHHRDGFALRLSPRAQAVRHPEIPHDTDG